MKKFKVLVAPNSFKECADSVEISGLIEKSFCGLLDKSITENLEIIKKPISDGGDGFLNVCSNTLKLRTITYNITSPFDNSVFACEVGYSERLKKIFIESANVLGLKLVPADLRRPLLLSSKGMGELLKQIVDDVQKKKLLVEEVIIGIGGTGTNDLGIGLCRAFGMKLYSEDDNELDMLPENFQRAVRINWQKPDLPFLITSIIDVDNALLGEKGASRIFGPQKGASPEDVEILESGFENILSLLQNTTTNKFISGAGGGLAAGLSLFLDAEYKFSHEFVTEDLGISSQDDYNLIITGEGSFDAQSMMNKGTMIVINEFSNCETPKFVIAGTMERELELGENVKFIELSKFFASPKESMEKIEEGIYLACKEIMRQFTF